MPVDFPRRPGAAAWLLGGLTALLLAAGSASAAVPERPGLDNSPLDAPLFYQLLIGELEAAQGEPGNAYQVLLDAARRTRDPALFRRSIEIALQARAGTEALAAARAWLQAAPDALEARRYESQLLLALNRPQEAAQSIAALLAASRGDERNGLIGSLPRLFERIPDAAQRAALLEPLLQPYVDQPESRTPARVALARSKLSAGDAAQALALAEAVLRDDPQAPGSALIAMEAMARHAPAEALVKRYLEQPTAEPAVRLAYVRLLTGNQRYADAVAQLETLTRQQPKLAPPWLTLGALHLELKHPQQAQEALERYLALAPEAAPAAPAATAAADAEDDPADGRIQAWLLLAQAAEQRRDYAGAERWLAKVESPQRALEVQSRRASLLARQGKLREARDLIRRVPERSADDARAKLVAEATMLRDAKHYREASEVMASANKRFADQPELLYEQAMVEEKLGRTAEMEKLLRRVIELKPDHHHAYNALGYSLADRHQRLAEAKQLIQKALELAPGEPFITDSLGWVEYRLGNRVEAARLLRQAYQARPDPEIAAHLGEVLWVQGERDEARRVWRDARGRDAGNEVLVETLARLKVDL